MADTVISVSTTDGVRIAVSSGGDGTPLLLIPGLGATRSIFDPLVPLLRPRRRTIVYDPRGVGDSELGALPLTMALLGRDAEAVLQGLDVPQADVFGASMGGVVAQQLAIDAPRYVRRLILAATAPPGRHAVPADPRATAALLGKGARTPEAAYRMACTVLYSPHFQRTHQDFIEEQIRRRASHPVRGRVFEAQRRALRESSEIWDRLPGLSMPVLVLHGTADVVTPFENAQLLATRIPGARTRWFDQCGHLFFHERPDESARVIDEFLRD